MRDLLWCLAHGRHSQMFYLLLILTTTLWSCALLFVDPELHVILGAHALPHVFQ